MLGPGGTNGSNIFPNFIDENRVQYKSNMLPKLQLFENGQPGVGTLDNMRVSIQEKLHMSLNSNFYTTESLGIEYALHNSLVSTGLKLSLEEDERKSSVTSGENTRALSLFKTEIDRKTEELSQFITLQEQNMVKDMREMTQRQTIALLNTIQKNINEKLNEKNVAIENMNEKNNVLCNRLKQLAIEAQSWRCKAKYYESVMMALRSNIKQLRAQALEGSGENEIDDDGSCSNDPRIKCRSCGVNEVSLLLIPCRHLCLCSDCNRFVDICPVCRVIKTASIHVYM